MIRLVRTRQAWLVALVAALSLSISACSRPPQKDEAGPALPDAGPPLVKTSENGPIKVSVSLAPQRPRLGDPLVLILTVEAARGIDVEMPPFGEALGRFSIVSFTPRSETTPDGATRKTQRYVLDAPGSGRQRVPPLRVSYADNRPGARINPQDGGLADPSGEILTEELPVDVISVLPATEVSADLRPLRGPLAEPSRARAALPYLAFLLGLSGTLALVLLLRALRRRAARKAQVSAFDVAIGRLGRLEDRGPPAPDAADAFYVELSDLVRRYIEDRFGVRAPELTTEEFLYRAQDLFAASAHQNLLQAFLSSCDKVKFAAYRPDPAESRAALADARRFLVETRPEARP
jgi:hypothetical protein